MSAHEAIYDWADILAVDCIGDVHKYTPRTARETIAARLRSARQQGYEEAKANIVLDKIVKASNCVTVTVE